MPQNTPSNRRLSSWINQAMFGDKDARVNLPLPKNFSMMMMGGFACMAWSMGNTIAMYVHPHYNTDTSPREDMAQYLNEVLEMNSLVIFGGAIGFGGGYLMQLSFRNYALNARSLQPEQLIESLLKLPGVYFLPSLVLKTAYDAIFINHNSDADYSNSSAASFSSSTSYGAPQDNDPEYTTAERAVAAPVLFISGYAAFRFAASGMGGVLKRIPGVRMIDWNSAIANTPKFALAATTMSLSVFAAQSYKEEYEEHLQDSFSQKLVTNMLYDFGVGVVGAGLGALAYDVVDYVGQNCCVTAWNTCVKGRTAQEQESDELLAQAAAEYGSAGSVNNTK
jgi:hypothetical protein